MNILTPEYQTALCRVIVQDTSFLSNHNGIIEPDFFDSLHEKVFIEKVLSFFSKYKIAPSGESMKTLLYNENYAGEDIDKLIEDYYHVPVIDTDFIIDCALNFIRRVRVKKALIKCTELLEAGEVDNIMDTVKEAIIDNTSENIGSLFWKETENIINSVDIKEQFITTGIQELDSALGGGAARGTLNVVITPPNRGKSTFLINIGKAAVLSDLKVVHYTFELSEIVISRRYLMSLVKMSKEEIKQKKGTTYEKIITMAEKYLEDSLIIKRYNANSVNAADIMRHLNLIKNKFGFIPSVMLFDYADIMAAGKVYEQRRHEIEKIYYDLRNIAVEYNSANWTASQTNREWVEKELITMEDIDECYKKAAASDVMLSVNQNLEERRQNPQRGRLFLTKSRDDISQIEIPIIADWARAFVGGEYGY